MFFKYQFSNFMVVIVITKALPIEILMSGWTELYNNAYMKFNLFFENLDN